MTSKIECKGCGRFVNEGISFCPYCGTSLGKLEEEYIFETTDQYTSFSVENLDRFLKLMKNPEELEEKIQKERPQIFEKQKKVTERILERFPEVRRQVIEDQDLEFNAFFISIPYEKDNNVVQHDCLLRQLAMTQNGLVNFSLDSTELAADLYAFDVPIWAPRKVGHELLIEQQKQIKECMPLSQNEFLYCAEPWWVCSKVFDMDGRWVNWRLLFKTEGLSDYVQKEEEVPLNFHLFSNMEYSDIFSIAGTRGDGEVLVGVHKAEEKNTFKRQLCELRKMYEFGRKPEISTVRISWNTLKSLGLIGISAQQLLKSESGHFFRKTLSERIIGKVEEKAALETRGSMSVGRSSSELEFMDKVAERFLWYDTQGHQGGTVKITHGIPRELRKDYRVLGDKA